MIAAAIFDHDTARLGWALFGATVGFGVFAVIYLLRPDAMGFGDVRLAALLGLHLGRTAPCMCRSGCSSASCSEPSSG